MPVECRYDLIGCLMTRAVQIIQDIAWNLNTDFLTAPFHREANLLVEIPAGRAPDDIRQRANETNARSVVGSARQEYHSPPFQSFPHGNGSGKCLAWTLAFKCLHRA